MNAPFRLLLVFGACRLAGAQQVPNIDDIYAADREAELARMGPAEEPAEILDRYAERMRTCRRLDYSVDLTFTVAADEDPLRLEGVVAIGRGPEGRFDRFRVDAKGAMPRVGPVDLTLGSTGDEFYAIDRSLRTVTQYDVHDDSIPFADLLRYVLISELARHGEPVSVAGFDSAEVDRAILFVDGQFEEHAYGVFSASDALPRRIERVVPGVDGRPVVVLTRIADLRIDDAGSRDSFEADAPADFRKLRRSADEIRE